MPKSHYNEVAGKDVTRSIAISDGVFAVALTLLMIDLSVPVLTTIQTEAQLMTLFIKLFPKLLVSFLAFMTVGIFWMGHSAQYKHIQQSDRNLSWINLFFLLSVTLLPFTTSFLGNYVAFKFPLWIYWFNLFLMGVLLYIHWSYAYKHHFIHEEERELINRPMRTRIILAQSLYFGGALLCFINPYLSIGVIILVQLNYAFAIVNGPKT